MLIGFHKLNRQIQKAFRKAIGEKLSIHFSNDFYYNYRTEKIYYTLLISDISDRTFRQFIETEFNLTICNDIELFCISVLHEIGHYYTYDDISEEDIIYSTDEKQRISDLLEQHPYDYNLYCQYYYLPEELEATSWGINWIQSHNKQWQYLVCTITKALNKFYQKNISIIVPEVEDTLINLRSETNKWLFSVMYH